MPIQSKQQPPYYREGTQIKEYTALLSQSGTDAPTAIILKNTIGNIVWTYSTPGEYNGTLTAAFPLEKTTLQITQGGFSVHFEIGNSEDGEPSNSIYITTKNISDGSGSNGQLYYTTITIKIYQ